MLRISLIIAIVAGLAGLYFANLPIAGKIKSTAAERDEAQTGKKAAEDQVRTAKASLSSARTELEKVASELGEKTTALENQTRIATTQLVRANAAQGEATRLQGERNSAQAELEKFKGLNLEPAMILQLNTKRKDAEKERDVFKSENEILARQLRVRQEELDRISVGTRKKVELPKGLSGAVVAVDPKFDFVVLNIGTSKGLLEGGELLVGRNGKFIAKVVVTRVEADRSIANVISDWKLGNVLEGDVVIY